MPAYCTNCAEALEPGAKFCAACGTRVEAPSAPPPPAAPAGPTHSPSAAPTSYPAADPSAVRRRYPALRIVAVVLKVAAIVWVIIGVIALIVIMAASGNAHFGSVGLNPIQGVFAFLTFLYFAVMSWAGAELLHVFMDIEENTRRAGAK